MNQTGGSGEEDQRGRYFMISPTVTWRIFDACRIFSNIKYQKAKQQEADLRFRSAVLTALKEVEDALAAYALEHERRAELAEALHGSAITLALAQQQYQHGLTSFLNVLDAERNVYSEEDQLAQSDAAI